METESMLLVEMSRVYSLRFGLDFFSRVTAVSFSIGNLFVRRQLPESTRESTRGRR
ncbi:hypothetical protein Bca4012_016114 [Brassica carinata]